MKILIIGDSSSIHIYNFIKYTALSFESAEIFICDIYGNTNKGKNNYWEFYQDNCINIIHSDTEIQGRYEDLVYDYLTLREMGTFDVCHIHFLNRFAIYLALLIARQCRIIIANYWGSDWLRASSAEQQWQAGLLNIADYVVTDSREICSQLDICYDGKYNKKTEYIRFKLPVIECIKGNNNAETVKDFKANYGIPGDKTVVVCGYSGIDAHKHIPMIEALKQLDIELQKNIFVIFPMTYGATPMYISTVYDQLWDAEFVYKILTNFMSISEVAVLRKCTDIFMLMEPSDAYSSTILEYTYCNTIVINGSWLDYSELEKLGAYYEKVDSVADITMQLNYILRNMESVKNKFNGNKETIAQFQELYDRNELWAELYTRPTVAIEEKIDLNESKLLKEASLFYNKGDTRNQLNINILATIANLKSIEAKIENWILQRQVYSVGIYGLGKIGNVVCRKLLDSKIRNLFVFDRNIMQGGVVKNEIGSPEAIYQTDMDVLIITPALYMNEIKEQYLGNIRARVLTIVEWLDELQEVE